MLGELISAGANLITGFFNRNAQQEYNQQQNQLAQQNLAFQREAATHGIRWKTEDALAAGVHPIYALGAPTFNPSPVSMGGEAAKFPEMGQSLGAAASAMMPKEEKLSQYQQTLQALQLERGKLENDLLKSQIANSAAQAVRTVGRPSNGSGAVQPTLVAGQPDSPSITRKQEQTYTAPGNASQQFGSVPDVGFAATNRGHAVVPSKDVKEQIEDVWPAEVAWGIRNLLMPALGAGYSTPPVPLKPGYVWGFNPFTMSYEQIPEHGGRRYGHYSRPTHRDAWVQNSNRR